MWKCSGCREARSAGNVGSEQQLLWQDGVAMAMLFELQLFEVFCP